MIKKLTALLLIPCHFLPAEAMFRKLDLNNDWDIRWATEEEKLGLHLRQAVQNNNRTQVAELLKQGANPNKYLFGHKLPLLIAVTLNFDITQLLIEKGACVNAKDVLEKPIMHCATQKNSHLSCDERYKICEYLIKKDAEVRTATLEGCIAANDVKTAKLLITSGFSCDSKTSNENLLLAARCPGTDMVRLILDAGADITASDINTFETALAIAAQHKNKELCEFLVDRLKSKRNKFQHLNYPYVLLEHLEHGSLDPESKGFVFKRAYDYYPLDCLNPNVLRKNIKSLEIEEEETKNEIEKIEKEAKERELARVKYNCNCIIL